MMRYCNPGTDAWPVVRKVMANQQEIRDAAEAILFRLLPDSLLNSDEQDILRLAGIADSMDLERERGRVAAVRQQLKQAGSSDQLLKAEKAAIEAAQAFKEKGAKLEQQIAELNAKLDELKANRDATQNALGRFTAARENLRSLQLLPKYIGAAYEAELTAVQRMEYFHQRQAVKAKIDMIEGLQRIDLSTVQGVRAAELHCDAAAPELKTRQTSDGRIGDRFNLEGFIRYRERRVREELPQLRREFNRLEEKCASILADVERIRGFYVDRL